MDIREKLWAYYYNKLSAGVDIGYSPKIEHWDEDLSLSLKKSIAEFSAFKETSFKNALESLLVQDGKLLPWKEFQKEALKVSGDYNVRWLETEYHQTVANAHMAGKWKDFKRNADLYPNLKLSSVQDGRVRPEHKALDGTIRPINDPFWDTHTPPLDWGCRCDIEQTDEEPSEIKGGLQLKIEFQNNPGKTGEIFGGTAYSESISKQQRHLAERSATYYQLKQDANYHDVAMNDIGGVKATHINHKFDKVLGHHEKEVQDFFFKKGDMFILEEESNIGKQVEGYLNGEKCEIKTLLGDSSRTIRKRISQVVQKDADIGILYFPEKFNKNNLDEALSSYKGKMPKLVVLHGDKIIKDDR